MKDIVERLNVSWSSQNGAAMTKINRILHERKEAAAEITRLRAEVERLTRERAEASERAAQIADAAADRFGKHEHPYGFNVIAKDALTGIASAIRQAASGESGT